ncbi:hypothetical protein [Pontibacter kalidii]|uniref:hypothetical protein n=1 Tax=Pontibacter kalidii TaxID=2592049 RepID=UPI002250178A|nr:hypothetical protein [Pontibacter kalidii]
MQKLIRVGWVVAALLVGVNLILDKVYITTGPSVVILAVDTFVQLLMLLALGSILAALVAAIPFRGRGYSGRYKVMLPYAVALTAGLMNVMMLILINP